MECPITTKDDTAKWGNRGDVDIVEPLYPLLYIFTAKKDGGIRFTVEY